MHGLIICVMLLWFLCRSRALPPLSFSIISKIALLGLIGYACSWQNIYQLELKFMSSLKFVTFGENQASSFLCFLYNDDLLGWWWSRSSSQIMGYTGINYSSPALASAISNLTPAFTFIFAIIFRYFPLLLSSGFLLCGA